jgi:3-hydroxyacyl-CoA dehydrogenase
MKGGVSWTRKGITNRRLKDGPPGVKTRRGFYSWTDERIDRIIQQRDKALLRLTDVVKGLAREQKK